jgi:1-acyl-sn-glycerol-3-phosphate acyltransferase
MPDLSMNQKGCRKQRQNTRGPTERGHRFRSSVKKMSQPESALFSGIGFQYHRNTGRWPIWGLSGGPQRPRTLFPCYKGWNMLSSIPEWARGCVSLSLYVLNTLVLTPPLIVLSLTKFILPIRSWRKICDRILTRIAGWWIGINNWNVRVVNRIQWHVIGLESLDPQQWYIVVANHQSWVDILVLQKIFHRKIPFLKFFLKKELIWVPFLGLAWWALDFPFMKRYSSDFIRNNPHLKGKDLEITRKACEKFRHIPVSIMNFAEGTRFTPEKHQRQGSPYRHLLRPKAGGIAFVMAAMGDRIGRMLNVTIAYPNGAKSLWDFLCGRVREIRIRVEAMPISSEMIGDYFNDPDFRDNFQDYLNRLWQEKDLQLAGMLQRS